MKVYCTGHVSSEIVTTAMAEGFQCERVVPRWELPIHGPAAFYGRDRGTLAVMRQCRADNEPWYMADNGYLGASRYDGYYKISKNGWQCDGRGKPDYDRLDEVLEITGQKISENWREPMDEGHTLVCPPIIEYERVHAFSTTWWNFNIRKAMKKRTRHHMLMRYKPGDHRVGKARTLEQDFKNCHALITHDSNIVVDAILAGIPVFVTGVGPAMVFRNVDLANINNPRMKFDRRKWLAILAANQWTLDEIRAGKANKKLFGHKES